ncbi:MAG: energy-coupling factor ABC transporter substrate-binding protein [Archaeoglobaceae archaeon]|nr:energy-coupling factor ABC transporter substrate-binding protein [Archaeoglobaceae archaeon]MDW8128150.1 energy-coupling factor ABC transporter substrate-binding protein [Archaeoglobaceae archaeon]
MKIFKLILPLLLVITCSAQEWSGADEIAEDTIKELNPNYEPWFSPIFEPVGELETLFFSIQAAIGGFLIGYFLGKHERKS